MEMQLKLNTMSSLVIDNSNRSINSSLLMKHISLDILYGLELIYKRSIMFRLGQNFDTQLQEELELNGINL